MDRPIPAEIVARVQKLAAALGVWCDQGRDRTLAEHEDAAAGRGGAGAGADGETRCRTVPLAVPWYHCGPCGRGWSVASTTLGVPARARLLRHQCGRLDYPTLRLDGLPLGSGAIESAADLLLQRRIKRAGMRWSEAGARAMLALRARLRSGRSLTTTTRVA